MQIQKADAPIIQLHQVWKVREISFATELRIFRSTVLYRCKFCFSADESNKLIVLLSGVC